MQEPKSKTLNGYVITVAPLPGWQSLETLQTLAKMIGPALGKLGGAAAASIGNETDAERKALEGVTASLMAALVALQPGELQAVGKALLGNTMVLTPKAAAGEDVAILRVFDTEFAGQTLLILKILVFAIEVNYGDFFAALRPALAAIGAKLKSAAGELAKKNAGGPAAQTVAGSSSPPTSS